MDSFVCIILLLARAGTDVATSIEQAYEETNHDLIFHAHTLSDPWFCL